MHPFKATFIFLFLVMVAVPVLWAADTNDAAFTKLQGAALREDYPVAQTIGAEILSRVKSSDALAHDVQYQLAIASLRTKEYEKARGILAQIRSSEKDLYRQDKIDLALFDSYYYAENYNEAQNTIDKMLTLRLKSDWLSQIYFRAARVYLKQAQWDKARLLLAKIVNENPTSFEVDYARQLLGEEEYFTVQVGSFNERIRAEQMAADLKSRKEYAYIVESLDKNGVKYFRVRVGRLSALNEAQEVKSRLSGMGYPSARIYP